MRSNRVRGFGTGLLLLGIWGAALSAQSASSTRDGVYTARQAQQGKAIYKQQCGMCHGEALDGTGQSPALTGGDFLHEWDGQTVGNLADKIRMTMPATKPGSLTPLETSLLVAYILQANAFPAGKTMLPSSPGKLKNIRIQKP